MNKFISRLHLVLAILTITAFAPQVFAEKLLGLHSVNLTALYGLPSRQTAIQQTGARVVRLPVTWHLMEESTKGVTPTWFWSQLDAEVAAANAIGTKLILTMAQTPCWASSDPAKNCATGNWNLLYPPTNVQDYADALGRMAARYSGKVYAYEIWNEPNLIYFWAGQPSRTAPGTNDPWGSFVSLAGATKYAQLVVATYPSVKAADANAFVLAGSIAGGDTEYLNTLYQNSSFKNSFDGISMHPYTAEYPGANATGARFGPNECPAGATFWCSAVGVNNLRAIMVANGNSAKDIWFTEFGFSSSHYWNGSNSLDGTWDSENGQAKYLTEMVDLIKNWSFVNVACWYNLLDSAPHEPRLADAYGGEREAHYGLYYSDGTTLKPSGTAFKVAIQNMAVTPPPPPPPPPVETLPVIISPINNVITTTAPTYNWKPFPNTTTYTVWLNNYAATGVDYNGIINVNLTPAQAACTSTQCSYKPAINLLAGSSSWWVTSNNTTSGISVVSSRADFQPQ